MKVLYYIIAILLAPVISIVVYASFNSKVFSNNQLDWGSFGSFIGGVSAPIISAITLIFLIQSYRLQSKQSAMQLHLALLSEHLALVDRFRLKINSPSTSHDCLKSLWDKIVEKGADLQSEQFKEARKNALFELEPIIESTKFLLSLIDDENLYQYEDRKKLRRIFFAKINTIELKLTFAVACSDELLRKLLFSIKTTEFAMIHLTEAEKRVIDFIFKRIQ